MHDFEEEILELINDELPVYSSEKWQERLRDQWEKFDEMQSITNYIEEFIDHFKGQLKEACYGKNSWDLEAVMENIIKDLEEELGMQLKEKLIDRLEYDLGEWFVTHDYDKEEMREFGLRFREKVKKEF